MMLKHKINFMRFSWILLCFLLLFSVAALAEGGCGCGTENAFTEGLGTEKKPYVIETPGQFLHMESHNGCCFAIGQALDFSGLSFRSLFQDEPFRGTLQGKSKAVTGITVLGGENAGIFARIDETGTVAGFRPEGTVFTDSTTVYAGGIAGINNGTVHSSRCRMKIEANEDSAATLGGVVGLNGEKGMITVTAFAGTLPERTGGVTGAIVGENVGGNHREAVQMITAHAGFAAEGGTGDQSEDNTLPSVVKAINLGAQSVEIDVRRRDFADGTFDLAVAHDAKDLENAEPLTSFLDLFLGKHPLCENLIRDPNEVRVQFDLKDDVFPLLLDALDEAEFPYSRVICTAHPQSEEETRRLRNAVENGMELYCTVKWIGKESQFKYRTDAFVESVKAYPIQPVTLNVSYKDVPDAVLAILLENGIRVSLWTVNDELYLQKYLPLGLANLTTRNGDALQMLEDCRRGLLRNTSEADLPPVGLQD